MVVREGVSGSETNLSVSNITRLAWPTVLSNAVILIVGLVDLYFVGKIGTNAIAAVSLAAVTWWTIANFFEGLRHGTIVLAARMFGEGKHDRISQVLNAGFFFSLIFGVALIFLAYPLTFVVYEYMTQNEEVRRLGMEYLPVILYSSVSVFFFYVVEGFMRGLKSGLLPTILSVIICSLNAFLDWVLVLGKLGAPAMGVKGAAVATAVANFTGGVLALLIIFFNEEIRQFVGVRKGFRDSIREYARVAFDVGVYSGAVYLATFFFTGIMSWISTQTVAAHQIANQVFYISYLPPIGFMLTASILVGHLLGEGRGDLVKIATKKIMVLCVASVTVVSVFTFWFARPLAGIFSPTDAEVVAMATKAIRFVAINQVCCAVYLVLRGVLTGAGDVSYVLYAGFVSGYVFFLPVAYLFSIVLEFGLMGGYVALWLWTLVSCALFGHRFVTKTAKLRCKAPIQMSIF